MKTYSDFLFELVKIALGNADNLLCTLDSKEWDNLYEEAERQSLVGVCFVGIQKLPKEQLPYLELLMEWMGQTERIRSRNEQLNDYCLKLQKRLDNDNRLYCILKGQGVALYYGELSSYRQSGDIDVWISGGFDKVVGYVNGISETDKVQDNHIELNIFNDAEVEAHFLPTRLANLFANMRLNKWFATQEQIQMENVVSFSDGLLHVPTIEFNLVYLLLHIYRHLFSEGIGLRQLMDYYFALKVADIDDSTKDRVKNTVASLGLDDFAGGIMWVLHKAFGMDLSLALWTPNAKKGSFLLSEIVQMGNFGHQDDRFKLGKDDSHLLRYTQMIYGKLRFVRYFPSEVFWQSIEILVRFFKIRLLRRRVREIANKY